MGLSTESVSLSDSSENQALIAIALFAIAIVVAFFVSSFSFHATKFKDLSAGLLMVALPIIFVVMSLSTTSVRLNKNRLIIIKNKTRGRKTTVISLYDISEIQISMTIRIELKSGVIVKLPTNLKIEKGTLPRLNERPISRYRDSFDFYDLLLLRTNFCRLEARQKSHPSSLI